MTSDIDDLSDLGFRIGQRRPGRTHTSMETGDDAPVTYVEGWGAFSRKLTGADIARAYAQALGAKRMEIPLAWVEIIERDRAWHERYL